jgi:cytochrome c-type biogenesis protein CcmE
VAGRQTFKRADRPRWGRYALWGAVTLALVLGVGAALEGTLVYAKTPAELRSDPHSVGLHTRVEGTVVPGSLTQGNGTARFVLSEGGASVPVDAQQAPPGSFRAGQDAVVEGTLGADGVFVADAVVAKHGNVYRAPAAGAK